MILEYSGADYVDKQYSCGPAPDYDKSCWFGIKNSMGLGKYLFQNAKNY